MAEESDTMGQLLPYLYGRPETLRFLIEQLAGGEATIYIERKESGEDHRPDRRRCDED